MKTQHTPGPWKVEKTNGCLYIEADMGKNWNNPTICNLYDNVTPEDSVTMHDWYEVHENSEANATLIAAAPELLEALELLIHMDVNGHELIDRLQFSTKGREISDKIRVAISKAKGGL